MKFSGGCYCGDIRYEAEGDPMLKAQCHCRECQYIAGGSPNLLIAMPTGGFNYIQGEPKRFARTDLANAVTREFCGSCGTHLTSLPPSLPDLTIVKVGTMDEPAAFEGPEMAIYCLDKQDFHVIPEGMPTFERFPG